jgi:hypothetical protein
MMVRHFRALLEEAERVAAAGGELGDVLVAGLGGLHDVLHVRQSRGDLVIEIVKRPVVVTRRRRQKRAAS